jgi:hypothetical protein
VVLCAPLPMRTCITALVTSVLRQPTQHWGSRYVAQHGAYPRPRQCSGPTSDPHARSTLQNGQGCPPFAEVTCVGSTCGPRKVRATLTVSRYGECLIVCACESPVWDKCTPPSVLGSPWSNVLAQLSGARACSRHCSGGGFPGKWVASLKATKRRVGQ